MASSDSFARLETSSYITRPLISNVALSADGDDTDVHITCVETLAENLYIGTSAGEILHHVRLPPETDGPHELPTYILASRLEPRVNQVTGPGIQQILLLPSVSKACILSNNTLNFYTLPELSPAFPRLNLKPLTCGWVDGLDLNQDVMEMEAGEGVTIMMCLRNRIRLVKVGDEPARLRDIEFGACVAVARRGAIACVADGKSYALVDVEHQRKIPLFSITGQEDQQNSVGTATGPPSEGGIASQDLMNKPSRSNSTAAGSLASRLGIHERGHGRSSSLGVFRSDSVGRDVARSVSPRHGFDTPTGLSRGPSPRPLSYHAGQSEAPATGGAAAPPPDPPAALQLATPTTPPAVPAITHVKPQAPLKPVITSPSPTEFLLTSGTGPNDPGLGFFYNHEGEMVRGTMEFSTYPLQVIMDGYGADLSTSVSGNLPTQENQEGYALAVVRRTLEGSDEKFTGLGIEIQRWDVNPGEDVGRKEWLRMPFEDDAHPRTLGIRSVTEKTEFTLSEITHKLALKPLRLDSEDIGKTSDAESIARRIAEEEKLISRLCGVTGHLVIWRGAAAHWVIRNPSVLQLDARLETAIASESELAVFQGLTDIIGELGGVKPSSELEFFSLGYIRQKAALLLFTRLLASKVKGGKQMVDMISATELAFSESEVDPRLLLSLLPTYRSEVLQSTDGIWTPQGLIDIVKSFERLRIEDSSSAPETPSPPILQLMKRCLLSWRKKKGNPSVAEGSFVFPTVDAALLLILLELDKGSPRGPATAGSIRAELNAIVDGGVDCFDRAVAILEKHKRLYVLSRLYQSRKNAAKVLSTWRRIIVDPTSDAGGEFADGEVELRKHLSRMRDRDLVVEYGTWLAMRNPRLGVQIFADTTAKVRIEPAEALQILRAEAPDAVKYFLEYLVFSQKQTQHINELIAYYLDIVIDELGNNIESRNALQATYETYRALQAPKPTYLQFIKDNTAPETEWWQARLRLLQLLGSNFSPSPSTQPDVADSTNTAGFDIAAVLDRMSPYKAELVPEVIILDGRQGRHSDAIKLLTHGLGDFDTAISYCLHGGTSLFAPIDGRSRQDRLNLPSREQQSTLFKHLLHEFLALSDTSDRIERTGQLLERFGGWFDVAETLELLPNDWAVDIFSSFLVSALRGLVRDRVESTIVKALSGSQNLKTSAEFVEKMEAMAPVVVSEGSEQVA